MKQNNDGSYPCPNVTMANTGDWMKFLQGGTTNNKTTIKTMEKDKTVTQALAEAAVNKLFEDYNVVRKNSDMIELTSLRISFKREKGTGKQQAFAHATVRTTLFAGVHEDGLYQI